MSFVTESEQHERLNKAYSLAIQIKAEECQESFFKFFCAFWECIVPDELIINWHIKYLCNRLERLFKLYEKGIAPGDVVINVPPGSSKSTIATIIFPVWCWVRRPQTRILSGSYSGNLAIEHSVKSRDLIKSNKFEQYYPKLIRFKSDMDNKGFYENESHGTRISTSVGGTSTGRHADIILIDDPINPKKSDSPVERKNANDWINKTLSNRKTNKKLTPTILIMQRLNEDDPTGLKMTSGMDFEHICLPSEITDLDNVRPRKLHLLYKNGLLDPIRLDRAVLDDQKIQLGSIGYGGQFLQSPRDAEGNIFKREWFQIYNELPLEKPIRTICSWDTAFKKGEHNDFSVCTTWNEYTSGYYLIDFWERKVEYPELKAQIQILNAKHRPHEILVEDKASGISALQELRHLNLNLKGIIPLNDKTARANQITPTFEAKNVYFPLNQFTDRIIEQMTGFPNTKNDDVVDSITQFFNYVREKPTTLPIVVSAGRRKTRQLLRGYNA